MKTVTRSHSVNGSRLYASPSSWGRREPPLYRDMSHACGNRPTHDPHVMHDPPRRAFNACRGEAQASEGITAVKIPPHLPAHHSGPDPTTRCAYVWPRTGGSCRCTKVGALLFYPFTCARAVEATPAATLSRAKGGSRSTRILEQRSSQEHKPGRATPRPETQRAEGEVGSPGKTLAGAASAAPARALLG